MIHSKGPKRESWLNRKFRFSVIIAVYNDWLPLERCLRSLACQTIGPSFEVVIVDDGSQDKVPESILNRSRFFPLTAIRQCHAGIPAARNSGIKAAKGSILLFVDADCDLQSDCLAILDSTIAHHPEHNCFQLRLTGDCSTLVGRAEELRLLALQRHLLHADGRIHYLNTAGFAIRRSKADKEQGLFNPTAPRGEDTLLLVTLMQQGELPLFVTNAVVQHAISLSLSGCFRKDFRTVFQEKRAFEIIAAKGVRIRLRPRERFRMLLSMWRASANRSIGRAAWFVVMWRQGLQRTISLASRYIC
jgi:glycosyltransferase involved in cell wall biosynthesis